MKDPTTSPIVGGTRPTGAGAVRTTPSTPSRPPAPRTRVRTVTPRAHDGMVESLRALKIARTSAISARRVALQLIHATIISVPEERRDQLRNLTRMQLIRTLAGWRPDLAATRSPPPRSR